MYIYTYIHIYIYTYIHIFIYTYIHTYIYTYVHIYRYIDIYFHRYTCVCVCIYIYMYVLYHILGLFIYTCCEPNPWCKVPSCLTPSVCRATGEPRWVYSACSCHFWLKMVSCDSGFTAALQSKVVARLSSSRPCDKGWQKVISGPVRWDWRDPGPFGSQLGAVLGSLSGKNRNGRGYYSSPPAWLGKYECSTEHCWKQSRKV